MAAPSPLRQGLHCSRTGATRCWVIVFVCFQLFDAGLRTLGNSSETAPAWLSTLDDEQKPIIFRLQLDGQLGSYLFHVRLTLAGTDTATGPISTMAPLSS